MILDISTEKEKKSERETHIHTILAPVALFIRRNDYELISICKYLFAGTFFTSTTATMIMMMMMMIVTVMFVCIMSK